MMFKFSFSPGCTENSSLTLGVIFVLLFSFSIAFDWKQWCFKESYLDKTEPCPVPLMMEAQALLWERQVQSREEERQALDPPHPCAACSQSSSPLPSSDMPTAAFSSRLVKCPSPRQGAQMRASAFQEPSKASALESDPVKGGARPQPQPQTQSQPRPQRVGSPGCNPKFSKTFSYGFGRSTNHFALVSRIWKGSYRFTSFTSLLQN